MTSCTQTLRQDMQGCTRGKGSGPPTGGGITFHGISLQSWIRNTDQSYAIIIPFTWFPQCAWCRAAYSTAGQSHLAQWGPMPAAEAAWRNLPHALQTATPSGGKQYAGGRSRTLWKCRRSLRLRYVSVGNKFSSATQSLEASWDNPIIIATSRSRTAQHMGQNRQQVLGSAA